MQIVRMTAAAGSSVEEQLRTAFVSLHTNKSAGAYKLRFTIDGVPFETIFHFLPEEHQVSNGCVSVGTALHSSLSSNSPTKGCFSPTLSKETLPSGITQTDVLQTLSTKLKFTLRPDTEEVSISDVAKLLNPATGLKYPSSFSLWRLLRGEPTIYEKYGYTAPSLDAMRTKIGATRWADVKAFKIFGRETLEAFVAREYPEHFEDGKPISDSMKEISYEDANRITVRHIIPTLGNLTIIDLLLYALGFTRGMPGLSVHRDSPIWRSWDTRLLFTEIQELVSPVATSQGGFRRKQRRTRRSRKTRRKQRRFRN